MMKRVHSLLLFVVTLTSAFASDWNLERWTNITGNPIINLESSIDYPHNPITSQTVTGPLSQEANWGNYYGSRVRAYLTAPATGTYYFWISGDDYIQLYLSSDSTPENRSLIANINGWTDVYEWDKYASQISAPVNLVADEQYYLELLHKEGNGGDHFSVAWSTTLDTDTPEVISGDYLTPVESAPEITGLVLTAGSDQEIYYPRDTAELTAQAVHIENGNNNIIYNWEQLSGPDAVLDAPDAPNTLVSFPSAGTYEFQVTATRELDTLSDLVTITVHPALHPEAGSVDQYYWFNAGSGDLYNFVAQHDFPTEPDAYQTITSLSGPRYFADRYGSLTKGYLLPPKSGRYRFYLEADEYAQFSLNTDAESLNMICEVNGASVEGDLHSQESQVSEWIELTAGTPTEFELIFKDRWSIDFHRVYWEFEDDDYIELIQGEFLAPLTEQDQQAPELLERNYHVLAGSDQTLYAPDFTTSLNAYYSRRSGDKATAIQWVDVDHAGLTFSDSSSTSTELTLPGEGTYTVSFQVTTPAETITDELTITVLPPLSSTTGGLTREVWMNAYYNELSDLFADSRYPSNPTITDKISSFASPVNWSNKYGQKISGYLQVPQTASYQFYLSGDDHAEFHLSTDDSAENLTKISEVTDATGVGEYDKYAGQVSEPITLTAGQRYYVEIYQVDTWGGDHVQLAWVKDGIGAPEVIQPGFLSPVGNPDPYRSEVSYYAYAGEDRTYYWPHQECSITGQAIKAFGSNLDLITTWSQLSGPDAVIESPESYTTNISFSEPGTYAFSFSVIAAGIEHSDTMVVTIAEPINDETGFLTRSVWLDIEGGAISDFLAYDPELDNPTFQDLLPGVTPPSDFTDYYGTTLEGYISVPVSGEYKFWIAGDNNTQLWLSTDESFENLTQIIDVPRAVNFQQWDRDSRQVSEAITLVAGERYYMRSIHKEHSWYDHFSIALEGPATNGREELSRGFISPATHARDHDPEIEIVLGPNRTLLWPDNTTSLTALVYDLNDGPSPLSYQWSCADENALLDSPSSPHTSVSFSTPGLYEISMTATDGEHSRTESLLITVQDPLFATTGALTREIWQNITGWHLDNLTSNALFPDSPAFVDSVDRFDSLYNYAENYGQRLRGYLTVPVSGDYEFFIASDDHGQLWMNTSGADPEGKTMIAECPRTVGRYDWTRREGQQSEVISLTKGEQYYIEALHKESGWSDHLAVAYRLAGSDTSPTVIPGAMLSPIDGEANLTNAALLVEAGPNQKHHFPTNGVSLSGSTIDYQPGPFQLSYQWSITKVKGDFLAEDVTIENPNQLTTSVRFPGAGKYTFKLTVTDGAHIVSDTMKVTIAAALAEDAGSVLVDAYNEVSGGWAINLKDVIETTAPSERFRINSMEAPYMTGDRFGWVVRGYLLPPASGVYRFNIAGDNWAEAFLSSDDTPENKSLLCLAPEWTYQYEWDKHPEYQLSRPVVLRKGRRYYIEVRFKEHSGADHFSLAWLRPRHEAYEVIQGAYLAPYLVSADLPPVITLEGEPELELTVGSEFVDAGFSALSGTGLDLTSQVRVEGTVDTSVAGTYYLRYFVADEHGTEAQVATRTVTVSIPEQTSATYLADQGSTHAPATWTEPDNVISDFEASRFLIQSSFGPTESEIDRVQDLGYEGWIDAEISKPASLHLAELDRFATFRAGLSQIATDTRQGMTSFEHMPEEMMMADISHDDRIHSWWTYAIDGDDQLRQRVAFALSEIIVISDYNPVLERYPRGVTNFYDLLVKGAFGNFRDLLEEVTLNPMMGYYLTMLRSDKASPDENYAREIMQLFTIGLEELNLDGTKKLDADGNRQSTYKQSDVSELARAFTGWTFNESTAFAYSHGPIDSMNNMMPFNEYHDTGEKHIIGGAVIPAGQTPQQDLEQALDVLFNHPNVGPFLARRLIQRLVTSNPSPAYIYRVASVFNDDGEGVRGNLGAVVKAILLDPEARDFSALDPERSGQLREPLIRATHLIRAFRQQPSSDPPVLGRFPIRNPYFEIREAPLWAVSVFNFFEPDFQVPGPLMDAGLYAPEFQITNEVSVVDTANYFFNGIRHGFRTDYGTPNYQPIDYSEISLIDYSPDELLDRVETLLVGRPLSAETRLAFHDLATSYETNNNPQAYGEALLQILMAIPEFAIHH